MRYLILFLLTFSLLVTCSKPLFSQSKFTPDEQYFQRIDRASALYTNKNYLASGLAYDSAFGRKSGKDGAGTAGKTAAGKAISGNGEIGMGTAGRTNDLYDAACSWAMAGNADKAFFYLDLAVVRDKWSALAHTQTDTDLSSLHPDKRWQPLLDLIKRNKNKKEARVNKELAATLDGVYVDDQQYRQKLDSVQKQFGWQSSQMDSLVNIMNWKDSINLVTVEAILDKYGWLGPDEVGEEGSMALFLVIQHADSLTQVTFFPLMQQAVKDNKARMEDLALLQDRILTTQGKPQIYGSQVHNENGKAAFFPIEDEANVNKRRAAAGLGPIEAYGRYFGIDYHLPVVPVSGNK